MQRGREYCFSTCSLCRWSWTSPIDKEETRSFWCAPVLILAMYLNPFYINIHTDSNSEEDFYNFIVAAMAAG
jgi:hypothetical protein